LEKEYITDGRRRREGAGEGGKGKGGGNCEKRSKDRIRKGMSGGTMWQRRSQKGKGRKERREWCDV
jgi:hypothetical protein